MSTNMTLEQVYELMTNAMKAELNVNVEFRVIHVCTLKDGKLFVQGPGVEETFIGVHSVHGNSIQLIRGEDDLHTVTFTVEPPTLSLYQVQEFIEEGR